ncbi:hypothetical protein KBD87_01590 [Candidatus Saccharibacteria bacterium]|nr:hypothetical protein [Candidatus Saccharibacteria bacterium]
MAILLLGSDSSLISFSQLPVAPNPHGEHLFWEILRKATFPDGERRNAMMKVWIFVWLVVSFAGGIATGSGEGVIGVLNGLSYFLGVPGGAMAAITVILAAILGRTSVRLGALVVPALLLVTGLLVAIWGAGWIPVVFIGALALMVAAATKCPPAAPQRPATATPLRAKLAAAWKAFLREEETTPARPTPPRPARVVDPTPQPAAKAPRGRTTVVATEVVEPSVTTSTPSKAASRPATATAAVKKPAASQPAKKAEAAAK